MTISKRCALCALPATAVFSLLSVSTLIGAPPAVWTQHNDNNRTGANTQETLLTPANVNQNHFGKLFTYNLDDESFTQPLYVPNVLMGPPTALRTSHNVVYVATANNTVYAWDADSNVTNNGKPLWSKNLTPANSRPPNNADMSALGVCGGGYNDFSGNFGIVGTPVIDTATKTLFVVVRSVPAKLSQTAFDAQLKAGAIPKSQFLQQLYALDITSGAIRGGPVTISASANGVSFDPEAQNQRPALSLANGVVYITWASHCDSLDYKGWVIGYNASTLAQVSAWCATCANGGSAGGIWQAGQAPVSDNVNGITHLYFTTGNGTWEANGSQYPNGVDSGNISVPDSQSGTVRDFGMSAVKLTVGSGGKGLTSGGFFTPYDMNLLNSKDCDFGAAGTMMIPGTRLLLAGGKLGVMELLDTENMGGYIANPPVQVNSNVVEEFQSVFPYPGDPTSEANCLTVPTRHIHGTPVFFDGGANQYIYVWGENDFLRAYSFTNLPGSFQPGGNPNVHQATPIGGPIDSTAVASGSDRAPLIQNGMPGGFLSVSSNGKSNGIIWAAVPYVGNANQGVRPGILYAYDATKFTGSGATLAMTELWDSRQNPARDDLGYFAKFVCPTIANGKVYVPSFGAMQNPGLPGASLAVNGPAGQGQLVVYGLLPAAQPSAPSYVWAVAGNGQVTLSWAGGSPSNTYSIFRGASATAPYTAAAYATGVTGTSWVDSHATNGTTYYYVVETVNTAGSSGPSNEAIAKPGTGNLPVPVALRTVYNISGIYPDRVRITSGGLDDGGSAYPATPFAGLVNWNNAPFAFAPPGWASAVYSVQIPLPAGSFSKVLVLAAGVNGNQQGQQFTVHYSDGTSSAYMQSLSDWITPQHYAGESNVLQTYRNSPDGVPDPGTFNLYGYSFALTTGKTATSIQLPNNRNVTVLAITLAP